MTDSPLPLVDYPGGFHITLMHCGPLEALAMLLMLTCLGLALFRRFSPTGNTLLVAAPLALGAWRALSSAFMLIKPMAGVLEDNTPNLDIDWGIMGALAEIRAMLILGFLFSFLIFLAILLRHRRKATADRPL